MDNKSPAAAVNDLLVSHDSLTVEVAFALPDRQEIIMLSVKPGCTALEAVKQSGITTRFAEIELTTMAMGIFSRCLDGKGLPLPENYELRDHDRVEIYRPLQIDPRAARMLRVAKARKNERKEYQQKQEGRAQQRKP